MKKTIQLFSVLLLLSACKSENERRIVGKWQATQLMECDNIVPIQTELVGIEFLSNGKYVFNSTLNIKEQGNYRIKKNYLFTQDKLREKAPEKAVLIQSIDEDTLVLQMNYKGKDQWLTLVKEGATAKVQEKKESETPTLTADAGAIPADAAKLTTSDAAAADSIKKVEAEKKKQEEAAADKKREEEADRKREAAKAKEKESEKSTSSSEAYKKREAKRKAEERKAKEEAEKKAEKFRKEYAKREAERKKKEAAAKKK